MTHPQGCHITEHDIIVSGDIHLGLLLQYLRGANLIYAGVQMPKTSLPHHLVALWFADIAGYSARAAEDERGALELIEILQALSRSIVQRYEGRVVKFFGDALLAEFPSTEMAVRAAATLSQRVH